LGIIYIVLLIISILGIGFSRKLKAIPIIILLVVAAVLPLFSVRHLPLFTLAVPIFAGEHIADAKSRMSSGEVKPSRRQTWMALISLFIAILILIWGYSNSRQIWMTNKSIVPFPTQAVSLLKHGNIEGNLAVEFNWGEYVIWHLGPKIKVSVDGRRETVYTKHIYESNLSFVNGNEDWDSVINDFGTNMALITMNGPAYNLMKTKPKWELIYEDSTSALFASQDWEQIEILRSHAESVDIPPPPGFFP
jgi:hypothetical protein